MKVDLCEYAGHYHVPPDEAWRSAHINIKEMAAAMQQPTTVLVVEGVFYSIYSG